MSHKQLWCYIRAIWNFQPIWRSIRSVCMYVCMFIRDKKMTQVTEQHQVGHDESITIKGLHTRGYTRSIK